MPFTKRFKADGGSWRFSHRVRFTQVVGAPIILSLLVTSTILLAAPKIDVSLRKVADEPRNTDLKTIVWYVKEHTDQDDYVICGYPLIAFLADRRMPPIRGDENLTELSLLYNVKVAVIGAGFSPPYFKDYVRRNYELVWESSYWGSVYMKEQ